MKKKKDTRTVLVVKFQVSDALSDKVFDFEVFNGEHHIKRFKEHSVFEGVTHKEAKEKLYDSLNQYGRAKTLARMGKQGGEAFYFEGKHFKKQGKIRTRKEILQILSECDHNVCVNGDAFYDLNDAAKIEYKDLYIKYNGRFENYIMPIPTF